MVIIPNLQTRKLRQDSSAHKSHGERLAAVLHPEVTRFLPPPSPHHLPLSCPSRPLPGSGFSLLTARLQPEAQAMQRSWRNNPLSVRVRPDPFCHFLCDGRTRWAALGRLCLLSAPGPGNRKPVKRVWPKLCLVPKQVHSAGFHLSGGSFPEQSGGPRRSMRTQGHVST